MKHFHEQLQKRHGYKLCYTVTRLALQAAGLAPKTKRGGPEGGEAGQYLGRIIDTLKKAGIKVIFLAVDPSAYDGDVGPHQTFADVDALDRAIHHAMDEQLRRSALGLLLVRGARQTVPARGDFLVERRGFKLVIVT